MKALLFGIATATLAVGAQASLIPPHLDVTTSCHQVQAVYLHDGKGIHKLDRSNTEPTELAKLANQVPFNHWQEVGCSK